MRKNKFCNIFCVFFILFSFILTSFSTICAAETIDNSSVPVRRENYIMIKATVAEDYPEKYVNVIIKNDKGETVKELCLLDITLFKEKIVLDAGTYTLSGINHVDAEKFPIETVTFTVSKGDKLINFKVGKIKEPEVSKPVEETTEKSADVVEKETEKTTEELTENKDSLVSISDSESNNILENTKKIGSIFTFIFLGIFALIVISLFILYLYRKRNNNF